MTLMNKANLIKGFVIGTGDLSEIALGWSTFNGDHISHYNVNASIPKTLIRYLVKWISEQENFKNAKKILDDIIDTPISPELVKEKKGDDEKPELTPKQKLEKENLLKLFFLTAAAIKTKLPDIPIQTVDTFLSVAII